MRTSSVKNFNNQIKSSGKQAVAQNSTSPMRYHFGESSLKQIVSLISDNDASRLDGTIQGLYRYGDYMVKSPGGADNDSVIKEFYALMRMNEGSGKVPAPKPMIMSKASARDFLVEEFIPGDYIANDKYTIGQARRLVDKFAIMDQKGIISRDLSPENIICGLDGRQTVIDFDDFSFISEEGRVLNSSSTPKNYFAVRLPKSKTDGIGYSIRWAKGVDKVLTNEEMFGNSFKFLKPIAIGNYDLGPVINMSDNPYISVPSNLESYESGTIYKKIIDGEVEEPVEFLREYVQVKAEKYHAKMRDFLKTVKIDDKMPTGGVSPKEGRARLHAAIEYENFLANMFKGKKPDVYFAKLQAAKMQLNALMGPDNFDSVVSNRTQIHSSYEKLIKVIMDGLESFEEPEYQRYLKNELKIYTEAFSKTNFATTKPKQKVVPYLDMVNRVFSDPCIDKKAFHVLKNESYDLCGKTLLSMRKKTNSADLCAPLTELEKAMVTGSVGKTMYQAGERVDKDTLARGIEEVVEKISQDAQKGKFGSTIIKTATEKSAKNTAKEAINKAKTCASEEIYKNVADEAKRAKQYGDKYAAVQYSKKGGPIFALIGVVLAIGATALYKIYSAKKENENQVTIVYNPQATSQKLPINGNINADKDSPFKAFTV